jgi:L-iditol 2-dehydrogenase
MKACVLHGIGDLRLEKVNDPEPREGEVLVKVGACGVCGSDIPRVFSTGTYYFPTIPGHELAGEVVVAGPNTDRALIGRKVAIFPLIPCRHCPYCEIGEYAQCINYNYLGSRCDGGFAELVRAPEWNLVPVPEGLPVEHAAMVEPAAAALHALRQGGVDIGDTVAIYGAGPIGVMLGMWAESWGAGKVLLVDIDQRRVDFARALGFEHTFNSREGDPVSWINEQTDLGADLVIEGSGSAKALEQVLLSARPFADVVLMGSPAGEMTLSQDAYWAILRKQLSVRGTWNSSYSSLPRNEWELTLQCMANGKFDVAKLITHRVGLDGLVDSLVMMRDRTEFSNKVMYVGNGTGR